MIKQGVSIAGGVHEAVEVEGAPLPLLERVSQFLNDARAKLRAEEAEAAGVDTGLGARDLDTAEAALDYQRKPQPQQHLLPAEADDSFEDWRGLLAALGACFFQGCKKCSSCEAVEGGVPDCSWVRMQATGICLAMPPRCPTSPTSETLGMLQSSVYEVYLPGVLEWLNDDVARCGLYWQRHKLSMERKGTYEIEKSACGVLLGMVILPASK